MKWLNRSVSLMVLLPLAGCATLLGGEPLNLLTTEQEIELGKKVSAEVEQKQKVHQDAQLQAYLRRVGDHLAQFAPRQDVPYKFTVIDDIETVNAFALPGGHLYVYTGLMKLCENEAELASVMAHEIGHVAAHHHGESLTRQYGIELLLAIILGEEPAAAAEITAQVLGVGVMMRFSRDAEREADAMGLRMLYQGGYKPEAMLSFMNKMLEEERKRGGAYLPIFSSHPRTERRLQYLDEQARQFPTGIEGLYADRYRRNVLNRLK